MDRVAVVGFIVESTTTELLTKILPLPATRGEDVGVTCNSTFKLNDKSHVQPVNSTSRNFVARVIDEIKFRETWRLTRWLPVSYRNKPNHHWLMSLLRSVTLKSTTSTSIVELLFLILSLKRKFECHSFLLLCISVIVFDKFPSSTITLHRLSRWYLFISRK